MLFTIKKPVSKRFFQLSFEGFRPSGRNKLEQIVNSWIEFIKSLYFYVVEKFKQLFNLISTFLFFLVTLPGKGKSYLTKKLIWSRGKLGRPIALTVVMSVSLLVFFVGEVFSSSSLVVDKEVNYDFIAASSDITPKKEIALTSIPEIRQRTQPLEYEIQGGDTLSGIGEKFKVSLDALKYVNNYTDNTVLKVGQKITIPPISGLIHKVASGDTLESIARKYDVPSQAIADFNYLLDTSRLAVGTELVVPDAKVPEPVIIYSPQTAAVVVPGGQKASPSKNYCVWPTTVRIITQYFSWYHNGVDVATPRGSGMPPLFSCTEGTVIRAGWDPYGLGLHVRIDHGDGYETVYGHMSRVDVAYGDELGRGDQIGLMGSTGRSTGPHVHFMVKYNGVAQNPLDYAN